MLPTTLRQTIKRNINPAAATAKRAFASDESLVKTSLYDWHKELGGDMVPFAGYTLPVLYKGGDNSGVMKEHLWCREEGKCSLFDVSHMGQVSFLCYVICYIILYYIIYVVHVFDLYVI